MKLKMQIPSSSDPSLDAYDPVDAGNYYTIRCPECGRHSAYIYKDDIAKPGIAGIRWRCNRMNNCGRSGFLKLDGPVPPQLLKPSPEAEKGSGLSPECLARLKGLYDLNDLVKGYDFDMRGISNEILKANKVIYWPPGFQSFVKTSGGLSDIKRYSRTVYHDRDMIFPIIDRNGQIVRLLLRSTKPQKKKEIQLKVSPGRCTEIWNMKDLTDPAIKVVFLCEGCFDALSVKQAAAKLDMPYVGAVGIPGCKKIRKAAREIAKIPEAKGKRFVLAFDNDQGGREFGDLGLAEFKQLGLPVFRMTFQVFKDLNEFLEKKEDWFYARIRSCVEQTQKNMPPKAAR